MNVKALLLAAVVASVAGSTFANNFDNGIETQTAQMPRTGARVATDGGYLSRSDIPTAVKATSVDGRSRAEVRAETVKSLANGEARALRDLYVGGAQ